MGRFRPCGQWPAHSKSYSLSTCYVCNTLHVISLGMCIPLFKDEKRNSGFKKLGEVTDLSSVDLEVFQICLFLGEKKDITLCLFVPLYHCKLYQSYIFQLWRIAYRGSLKTHSKVLVDCLLCLRSWKTENSLS